MNFRKQEIITRIIFAVALCLINNAYSFADSVVVTKFGAKGDRERLNTHTIQKAIDYCSNTGGGEVVFPKGTYITGTLVLKDNVTLFLQQAAVIKGSEDKLDYPILNDFKALIYSGNAKNVAIRGYGTIDGSGQAFYQKDNSPGRPILVVFDNCINVLVQDVFLCN